MRLTDHEPDCPVLVNPDMFCTCADQEAEMVEDFQVVKPYRRSQTVPQSAPQGPYQSLASLIRAARRAGHLRPLQPYGGGHAPASVP
jgi:hypothetical protein